MALPAQEFVREPLRPAAETLFEVLNNDIASVIFPFLTCLDGNSLRGTSSTCRELASVVSWDDAETRVADMARFRACFPLARAARVTAAVSIDQADLFRGLRVLDFSDNASVSDEFLAGLSSGVRYLDISRCHLVTGSGLVQLTALHTLLCRECERLTDTGLVWVSLSAIHTLDVSGCRRFAGSGLIHMLNCRECTRLTVAGLVFITDIHTLDIGRTLVLGTGLANITRIHTLVGDGCRRLIDVALARLPGIQVLDISSCLSITDAACVHVSSIHTLYCAETRISDVGMSYLTNLRVLDISWSYKITDAGLSRLGALLTLLMRRCQSLTNAALSYLGSVRYLDIQSCRGITNAGLDHLVDIETLFVTGCRGITEKGVAALVSRLAPRAVKIYRLAA